MSVRGGVCDIRPRFWCHGQRTSGYPWFSWISMDIYRHPWTSIEILAIREVSMDTHGCSWISMDIYGYPLYPWVSVYPKKVSMTMYLHRFPTKGGGEPLYNPSSRKEPWGGPRVQAAHIPRISRAYLPRQNRAQAPDCRPPPQIEGGLPPTGMSMDSHGYPWNCLMHGCSWISTDVEVDARIFKSFH
jgi:hypothetical protein